MKRLLLAAALVLAITACGEADQTQPSPQPGKTFDFAPFSLTVTPQGDNLVLAVSTKTAGWIAIGTGNTRMPRTHIYMGVMNNGKADFLEQQGIHDNHEAAAKNLAQSWAVTASGDVLTLAVTCKKADIMAAGSSKLDLIMAASDGKSFDGIHRANRGASIQID